MCQCLEAAKDTTVLTVTIFTTDLLGSSGITVFVTAETGSSTGSETSEEITSTSGNTDEPSRHDSLSLRELGV
ncbi:hypothetical protein KY285_031525 [Solanum tuberosum]|nr:hypothetical protein KY284_031310 [Solanum tuberosum]KAH0656643.1 hypothetical protein KY285_031525 [Solanum tuberosum]